MAVRHTASAASIAQLAQPLQPLPAAGFRIIVHSRLDSVVFPPSEHDILRGEAAEGVPVMLPLYNRTDRVGDDCFWMRGRPPDLTSCVS